MSVLGDRLARLSGWQFAGLCCLLLLASGLVESMLPEKPGKRDKALIVIDKQRVPKPPAPPVMEESKPDTPPNGTPRLEDKQEKRVEIRIGGDGIIVRSMDDLERLGEKIEEKLDQEIEAIEDESRWNVSLPQLVFFLIIFMLIVRLLSKSKLKAEAETAVALDVAERETLSRQLAEARLQAMQAQVEPHFLFNTLAAVEHLIETDPPRAAQMQRNLIGYLRSVLPNFRKPDSTLGREVEICRHYLEILKMRMEDRLQIDINIPAPLVNASLPPMMLQSLVENAIRHGLEPKPEGGSLYLRAAVSEGTLAITVIDTGVGYDEQAKPAGGGLGLTNIRERLAALFGHRGRLVITPNLPHGTQVRIELPYESAPA
jgi:signal transduction histidine kinase